MQSLIAKNKTDVIVVIRDSSLIIRVKEIGGIEGEPYIKMYNELCQGVVALSFEARKNPISHCYLLRLESSFRDFKVLMKDGVEFHFDDGNILTTKFEKGKTDNYVSKTNEALIDPLYLLKIATVPINFIRLIAHKTGYFLDCHFMERNGNEHYTDKFNGQVLLMQMADAIIRSTEMVAARYDSLLDPITIEYADPDANR